jgi:single-stranded-DNA-specific exonuclease
LCTKKEERAKNLASYLGQKNKQRQDLVEKAVLEAKKILAFETKNFSFLPKIIILHSEEWEEGIIGLVAAKMVEEFYRPTIILTKNDGFYKGSARSIPSFHITNFLRNLKNYLLDVGGHAQAAGFTIEEKKLSQFKKEAEKLAKTILKETDLEKKIVVDLKLPISKINLKWVKLLEQLHPFGMGNPQPLFFSEGKIFNVKFLGKDNRHLKIYLTDENEKSILEVMVFNQADIFKNLFRNQKIKVVYSLEVDRWGGKEKVVGKLIYFLG